MQYFLTPTLNLEKWIMLELPEYQIVEIEQSRFKDYASAIDNRHVLIDPKIVDDVLVYVKDLHLDNGRR